MLTHWVHIVTLSFYEYRPSPLRGVAHEDFVSHPVPRTFTDLFGKLRHVKPKVILQHRQPGHDAWLLSERCTGLHGQLGKWVPGLWRMAELAEECCFENQNGHHTVQLEWQENRAPSLRGLR